jgi:hypothetical protein
VLLPQRTTWLSKHFSPREVSKIALPRRANPIILAAKAGIDPVGANYPKVSCPP